MKLPQFGGDPEDRMSSSADHWRKRSEDRFKAAEALSQAQQEDLTRF